MKEQVCLERHEGLCSPEPSKSQFTEANGAPECGAFSHCSHKARPLRVAPMPAFACAVLDSVKALSSGGHDSPHPTAYPGDSESLPSQARRPSPAPREGFLSDRPLVAGTEEQQTCLWLSPP